jgi:DNA-binding response OmpR family regulator
MRKILTLVLEKEFRVLQAESGEQALDLIYEHTPRVVLLDVNMPGISGLQVLSTIRYDPMLDKTKVALVTGDDSTMQIRDGIEEYNADAYFTKPVNAETIRSWVRAQLNQTS